jgi:hypothetical protein
MKKVFVVLSMMILIVSVKAYAGEASGNKVIINGKIINGGICGGSLDFWSEGTVTSNVVTISNASVSGDVYGGYIGEQFEVADNVVEICTRAFMRGCIFGVQRTSCIGMKMS